MYKFIFYVVYNEQISLGKSPGMAKYTAGLILGMTIFLQYMLILSILKKYVHQVNINRLLDPAPFPLTVFFAVQFISYRYFNPDRIQKNYYNERFIDSPASRIIVYAQLFLFLIFIIILNWRK